MRVLFVATNGAGLGHLTRGLAIARRLRSTTRPLFLTMSRAFPAVRDQGFYVEYLPSADTAAGEPRQWQALLERRLGDVFAAYDPDVVMFDGTFPYQGLIRAMDGRRRFVWCRRAMWRPGLGEANLTRAGLFDVVIEPGEFAAERDVGATRAQRAAAVVVDPIVLCDRDDLLERAAARAALGLDERSDAVLVQLEAGPVHDASTVAGRCVAALRRVPGLQVVVASSPLAAQTSALPSGVQAVSRFPLAPYLRAFDFAVTAAGYNSYHEMVAYAIPAVFVPKDRALDNQAARARYAQDVGVGTCWEEQTPAALDAALRPLLDPTCRAAMAGRAAALAPRNGAAAAAALLERLAVEGSR